ncbi:MAG: Holliday junction resolvase RuvX [Lachnospiraceae bacterium]|nr:Holliday junction resolvase RuvX [Lachnospiraceae bacterium]
MRIMGLDFGSKTVGVAVSDPLLLTAQGVEIIRRQEENKLRRTLARIEELIVEYDVQELVLGLPRHMNGTEGVRVELTQEFRDKLERRTGLPVVLWDERLTTVAADKTMMEAGIRREHRKDYVDMLAAVFILQGYLDKRNNENASSVQCGTVTIDLKESE